jgi:hypothetical protein
VRGSGCWSVRVSRDLRVFESHRSLSVSLSVSMLLLQAKLVPSPVPVPRPLLRVDAPGAEILFQMQALLNQIRDVDSWGVERKRDLAKLGRAMKAAPVEVTGRWLAERRDQQKANLFLAEWQKDPSWATMVLCLRKRQLQLKITRRRYLWKMEAQLVQMFGDAEFVQYLITKKSHTMESRPNPWTPEKEQWKQYKVYEDELEAVSQDIKEQEWTLEAQPALTAEDAAGLVADMGDVPSGTAFPALEDEPVHSSAQDGLPPPDGCAPLPPVGKPPKPGHPKLTKDQLALKKAARDKCPVTIVDGAPAGMNLFQSRLNTELANVEVLVAKGKNYGSGPRGSQACGQCAAALTDDKRKLREDSEAVAVMAAQVPVDMPALLKKSESTWTHMLSFVKTKGELACLVRRQDQQAGVVVPKPVRKAKAKAKA